MKIGCSVGTGGSETFRFQFFWPEEEIELRSAGGGIFWKKKLKLGAADRVARELEIVN
jgi:hypothetical protein